MGRIDNFFFFTPLSADAIHRILALALDLLVRRVTNAGFSLKYDPLVVGVLASHWQPEFGARQLFALVDSIAREISNAEGEGLLETINSILVETGSLPMNDPEADLNDEPSRDPVTISREQRGTVLALLVR